MLTFNEKQVGRKLIVNVLYQINEARFSIYRFLALDTKENTN